VAGYAWFFQFKPEVAERLMERRRELRDEQHRSVRPSGDPRAYPSRGGQQAAGKGEAGASRIHPTRRQLGGGS
jgi:hypothetical protein